MEDTLFLGLAELCDRLATTTKRKEKMRQISGFLGRLEVEEIAPAVLQIIGRIFPEADSKALEIGYSTIKEILERKKQTTLLPAPLTILEVRRYFDEISSARGLGSRQRRESLLESLLGEASPLRLDILLR